MHALVAYVFELAVLGIGIFLLLESIERQTEACNRDSFPGSSPDSLKEETQDQPGLADQPFHTNSFGSNDASNRAADRQIDHPASRPSQIPFEVRVHIG